MQEEKNDNILIRYKLSDRRNFFTEEGLNALIFKENDKPHIIIKTPTHENIMFKDDQASKVIQQINDFKNSHKKLMLMQIEETKKGFKVDFYDLVKSE